MKKVICLVLVAVMLSVFFVACAAQEPAETADADQAEATTSDEQLHIVYVTPLIAHEVWLVAKEGFDDACADYGIRGDWVGPSVIDANEMIKLIETAIAEKADGIITQGMNPEAMVPCLKAANEAGIPVVVVNSDIPDAPRLGYLGTEPINFGNVGAQYVIDNMGGKELNVAYMTSALDYSIGHEFLEGYEQIFNEYDGGYNNLTMVEDKADLMTAVEQWENVFTTYPECNVAVCFDASAAAGAAKVVEEKGLKDIFIMGIDDGVETLAYIESGTVKATLTQNFYRMGYQPVQWILDKINDGKEPAELLNDSGTMVVDQNNIENYGEDMRKPDTWK